MAQYWLQIVAHFALQFNTPRFQTLTRPTCNSHETFAKADNLPTSIEILMAGKLVGRKEKSARRRIVISLMAEWTGLEPATPGVTGRYSNQLNYHSG